MAIAPADIRRALEDTLAGGPTWDRSGDIIFYEDFSGGLGRWTSEFFGSLTSFQLSFNSFRTPPFSAEVIAGDAVGGGLTIIITHLPLPILSPIGLEMAFAPSPVVALAVVSLEWSIGINDGVTGTRYGVRWTNANNHLDYYNSAGGYTNFATAPALYVDSVDFGPIFHVGKLVIDPRTGTYRRFILDNVVYTTGLQTKSGQAAASAVNASATIQPTLTGPAGAGSSQVNLDDVIVTYNEPL